ncbi:MAG: hypothetical protein H6594_11420 [Flavobacteriales bacterium]|nr:hypothetical protein [Flavobacteriales bacterium]
MRPWTFFLPILLLAFTSCRKQKDTYPKSVRYEALCDSCYVHYFSNNVEHGNNITGHWSHSFTISTSSYLYMQLWDIDSAETAWVKIFLDDELYLSSSTDAPGVNGQVLATGYSPSP